jgi:hypothetical protein
MSYQIPNSASVFPNTKVGEVLTLASRSSVVYSASTFTGNGVVVAFTLGFAPVATALAELAVFVDRKKMTLTTDYTVSGSVITFTVAPKNNTFIKVVSVPTSSRAPSRGLSVVEGANAKQGVDTLVAGTKVVSNTSVTANSRIFVTSQVDGGAPGFLRISARTAGVSFTVTSSSGTDTSTFAYEIFEPGV